MMIITFFVLGLFFPWFLGYVILSLEKKFGNIKYFLSYPVGMGIISYQLFLYSIIGLNFNIVFIFLPWLILLSYIIYKNKIKFEFEMDDKNIFRDKINMFLLAVIIFFTVFIFSEALIKANYNIDSLSIWSLKAKAFFVDGKVSQKFYDQTRSYSHFDYPLLVPLSQTWVSLMYGKWSDTLIKIISPMFYLSLLGAFFYFLRRIASDRWGLVGTAVLSSFPVLIKYSQIPITDVPIVFYLFVSVLLIYFIFLKDMKIHFVWPAMFLLFLLWTKNEGLMFCFLILTLTIIYLLKEKKYKYLVKILPILGFLACAGFPWFVFRQEMGFHNNIISLRAVSNLSLGHIYFYTPIIVKYFTWKTLITNEWYGLWILYLITIFIYRKRIFKKPKEIVLNIINISLIIYACVFFLVQGDVNLLLSWTLDRLILHLVPLVLFFVIITFEEKETISGEVL